MVTKQALVHTGWLAVVLIAYFTGRQARTDVSPPPANDPPTARAAERDSGTGDTAFQPPPIETATELPEWSAEEELSGNKMRGIVAEISLCEDPLRQSLLFSHLLTKLTEDNATPTWEALKEHSQNDLASQQRISLFGYAWGLLQGGKAVRTAMADESREANLLTTRALEGWARSEPDAAMSFMQSEDSPATSDCRMGFLRGLARSQPEAAAKYLVDLDLRTDARPYLKPVIDAQLGSGFIKAEEWTKSLPTEKLRAAGCGILTEELLKLDPYRAAEWVGSFTEEPYSKDSVVALAEHFMGNSNDHEKNIEFMLDWMSALPEGGTRDAAYEKAVRVWANWDPNAAGAFLGNMPDSETKDLAIHSFSLEASPKDPMSAALWAATISDPELRIRTLVPTARQWLLRDKPATMEWLSTLDLPEETMDSILGSDR